MKTLDERLESQKKSLINQAVVIGVLGNIAGFQFFRVAKNYEKVNIYNISEVVEKIKYNVNTDFFFMPNTEYAKVSIIVALVAFCYYAIRNDNIRRYMKDSAFGSSRWANKHEIARLGEKEKNILLAKDVKLSTNTRNTKINNNVLVVGTSGSGKTAFYLKPNLMESAMKGIFEGIIVTDSKGALLCESASMMQKHGYKIKVFDIKNWRGNHWNPFVYFQKDVDILSFVNSLIENTNKGQKGGDPFWDNAATLLFNAVFFYLMEKSGPQDRTLLNVKRLIKLATISSEEDAESTLDVMMESLEKEQPHSKAPQYYKEFKTGAGKTLKSIIITSLSRLNFINLDEVDAMLSFDDMELEKIGDEKVVLYIVIPDDDSSFNFLSGMFIDQVFRVLIRKADATRKKANIHFYLDEFCNIGRLNYFQEKLSTIRSRNISASLIIQNLQQLESIYKGQDKAIIENCNTKLILGTSECAKWVSDKMGKITIDNKTMGRSKGRNSSTNYNESQMGRNLMDANEIEQLDKSRCIIMTQGNYPILAEKYNIEKHALYKELGDVNEDSPNNYEIKVEPIKKRKLIEATLVNTVEKNNEADNDRAATELLEDLTKELQGELDGLLIAEEEEEEMSASI